MKYFLQCFIFLISCESKENTNNIVSLEENFLEKESNVLPIENSNSQHKKIQTNGIYTSYSVYVNDNAKQVSKSHIQKICILKKEEKKNGKESKIKWKEVLELWQDDEDFMGFFISILKKHMVNSYYLEFVPIINKGNNDFEFVLYETTFGNSKANGTKFENHKGIMINSNVISFDSRTKSSRLIVPTNKNLYDDTFAHIASFTKRAPVEQQRKLWKLTSKEILNRIKSKKGVKTFVSTHGKEVAWLHVRVENKSNLFSYNPYKG